MSQQQRGQVSPRNAQKPRVASSAPPTPPPPGGLPASAAPRLPFSVREGSVWRWEPLTSHAAECTVTATRWNGEEWWIELETGRDETRHWNELDRFVEAAVLVRPGPQEVSP